MKYVFFGTPRFAEIILDRLIRADMPPIALVCNPDRPVGRKKIVMAPKTKQRALQGDARTINIIQPEKMDADLASQLQALKPDLFVVAAFAHIIPAEILDIPRFGTLGVHPSLLPLYRGSSPIQSVILNGEKETGTTIYHMDAKMDHGPIVAQTRYDAGSGLVDYETLEERLAILSADLLIATMPQVRAEAIKGKPQDESKATFTKKFRAEDGFIDENDLTAAENGNGKKSREIIQTINALNPEPGVWTMRNGKRIKLLSGTIEQGALRITKIQEEGGKARAA